jgi:hypothetical protein
VTRDHIEAHKEQLLADRPGAFRGAGDGLLESFRSHTDNTNIRFDALATRPLGENASDRELLDSIAWLMHQRLNYFTVRNG